MQNDDEVPLKPRLQLLHALGQRFLHERFALRLTDGIVAGHRPVDPPGGDPGYHQQRGSLNLGGGRVYFSYGGFTGDCGNYHGAVVSARIDGTGPLSSWLVPSQNQGAIWAPPGPLVSSSGDVWVSTADTDQGNPLLEYDGGNAVMGLRADVAGPIDS